MTLNCYKFKFSRNFALLRIFREATTTKWMIKIDQYYQRQKYSPMTLVSGNIRRMRIFAGVPLGGGVTCRRRQLLAIRVATSSETLEIRSARLHGDMLPLSACNWLQNEWPSMTLSGYFVDCRALTFALAIDFLSRPLWSVSPCQDCQVIFNTNISQNNAQCSEA